MPAREDEVRKEPEIPKMNLEIEGVAMNER